MNLSIKKHIHFLYVFCLLTSVFKLLVQIEVQQISVKNLLLSVGFVGFSVILISLFNVGS